MQLTSTLGALEADLTAIASVGDETVAAAAERLAQALRGSLGMRLLDLLGEAALEVSAQLPSGHVEVRLAGQDPSLVYVADEPAEAPPQSADDGLTARISLRLPESLKGAVELAASREGISVNAWLVRALARSVSSGPPRGPGRPGRLTGYAKS
jgi:hypothetical protein